jgi:hypothetical protein
MLRKNWMWALALAGVVVLGVYVYAAEEFSLECVSCGGSDSGTATGDGTGGVGTSDGTADFSGAPPTLESLGVKNAKDLRFLLTISTPTVNPADTCTLSPTELQQWPGFTCDFNYNAVLVETLRFFVVAPSYCQQNPNACVTIASVRLGEPFFGDTQRIVVYSADLIGGGGIEVGFGESDSRNLQLTKAQAQALDDVIKTIQKTDPDAELIVGLAVGVSAVDPDPTDTVKPHLSPFNQILTVGLSSRK